MDIDETNQNSGVPLSGDRHDSGHTHCLQRLANEILPSFTVPNLVMMLAKCADMCYYSETSFPAHDDLSVALGNNVVYAPAHCRASGYKGMAWITGNNKKIVVAHGGWKLIAMVFN